MAKIKTKVFTNVIIKNTAHLGLLLGHNALPQHAYALQKDNAYCFVYNKFLYGIYKLQCVTQNLDPAIRSASPNIDDHVAKSQSTSPVHSAQKSQYYIFEKIHNYHRLRLHHTTHSARLEKKLANKSLLNNLFHDENKTEQKLFLRIIDNHNHYMVSYAGLYIPGGIRHYLLRDDYTAIQRLAQQINDHLHGIYIDKQSFAKFQAWGRKLSSLLIKPELATSLCLADTTYVTYLNDKISLPLAVLVIGHPNRNYEVPFNSMAVYLHSNHHLPVVASEKKLDSLGVFTSKEDISMIREIQAITDKHRLEKTAPKTYSFGTLNTDEVLASLEQFDLVHLIFHGDRIEDEFTLFRNNRAFLKLSQMKLATRVPKVIFLSTCYSEDAQVLKWFFGNKGQSLITMYGDIPAQSLPEIVKAFYWQLFTRKSTIRKSFQAMLQKLYQQSSITFFKLKLHGNGDEYFTERENL
ncbi:hypothetical protein COTS27_00704 [Spirochaetota bacterium]|nr:hypothetical protein COTS27_00704 [Spirochaetota bacterium]